ncbi:protein of unknown function [Hyphomicrobium sp. MC1]|nr:protein of unknown function [Hyphomicrobium sp. MC1]
MPETAEQMAARLGVSVFAARSYLEDKVRIEREHQRTSCKGAQAVAALKGSRVKPPAKRRPRGGSKCRLFYEYKGQTLPLARWAERYGIKYMTLRRRIACGATIETALTTPLMKGRRRVDA